LVESDFAVVEEREKGYGKMDWRLKIIITVRKEVVAVKGSRGFSSFWETAIHIVAPG
jgi:hypothetical protein